MNSIQHDLSFDQTKLDYQALIRTAEIAYAHTRNELDRLLHRTHDLNHIQSVHHTAKYIHVEADQLVIAAETLHTLQEGLTRSQLEIVNKPEVADD